MNKQKFMLFYFLSLIGVALASVYPLYMGIRVVVDMIQQGSVTASNYPKYIIPYTPISLAVIVTVLLMPLFLKIKNKFAMPVASVAALCIFFVTELLLESKVIVTERVSESTPVALKDWQMFMCYVPPADYETRTWKAVDVLIGDYNPAFKLHFYLISIVIIVSILNSLYGFGAMLQTGDRKRKKALTIQSCTGLAFLGMCIWACFTAFYRTGEITVSSLSAILMSVFFILFGVTMGVFVGSLLLGRSKGMSVILPSVVSTVITLLMYIGEMILLSGHLYRFGTGILFQGIPGIVFAPTDILIIILSGCSTAIICTALNKPVQSMA